MKLVYLIYVRNSFKGLYRPGMTLFLAGVVSWWCSPDCVDFYWGGFHHPALWASYCGIFIFIRCMVQHIQFYLFLDPRPLSHVGNFRFRRVCCVGHSIVGPYTCHCPPYISSINLCCCLFRSQFMVQSRVPIRCMLPLRRFQPCFLGVSHS